jgi:hypothetical protein
MVMLLGTTGISTNNSLSLFWAVAEPSAATTISRESIYFFIVSVSVVN